MIPAVASGSATTSSISAIPNLKAPICQHSDPHRHPPVRRRPASLASPSGKRHAHPPAHRRPAHDHIVGAVKAREGLGVL
jgi:hypothetical protein